MPHAEATSPGVRFAATATYTRQPTERETSLFFTFADHIFVCPDCSLRSRTLCDNGHYLAQLIAKHVYSKAGKTFSATEREEGSVPVQVEIPVGCESVRTLLRALEEGRGGRQSADRSYYVAPRRSEHAERPAQTQPQPQPQSQYYASDPYTYAPAQAPEYTQPAAPRTRKRYSVYNPQPASQQYPVYATTAGGRGDSRWSYDR
ncbi:MAG: hypothetical protein M1824_005573 [Vezdaea acicularis]|nr:MAG: hypothetical protein M1824_005573 [Vezdaea acicularis]